MSSKRGGAANWQRQLERAFRGSDDKFAPWVRGIAQAEADIEDTGPQAFQGFRVVGEACLDFAIESLDVLAHPPGTYHILRTPLLVASVSRLRSSYVLFWKGYYFDSASLLRGVFENAIHLCADAHEWADLGVRTNPGAIDLKQPPNAVAKQMHARRLKHDKNVMARVYGAESGLGAGDQEEIKLLVNVLHSQVHHTEMHMAYLVTEVQSSRKPASVLPRWDSRAASHYPNVMMALGWMFARLLAFAVPMTQRDEAWAGRRDALDQALRCVFEAWEQPIGASLIRLIDLSFRFDGAWKEPSPGDAPK